MSAPGNGPEAGSILRFARESPDVFVVIRKPFVPATGTGTEESSLLLVGFIAGNVRAQLIAGRSEDSPVEGVVGALSVYRKLQARTASFKIPEYEALAALEAEGSLDARVRELAREAGPAD